MNNWTFKRFVAAQKEQHTIMGGLNDHKHCGLDVRTKVTCLLDGIKTDSLDAVKSISMQDSKLLIDFEMCAAFYKDLIKQSRGDQNNEARRVAEVGLHNKWNNDVEYRYYSNEDYKKLSTNAKEKLRKLCKGRPQGGRTRGGGDKGNKPHKKVRKL